MAPTKAWAGGVLASWYGQERAGHHTANGSLFNPYGLTAAHRTLPFGTVLQVTNLANRRQVIVVITDRGPGIRGRTLDVSLGAAERLGMVEAGLARVTIVVVSSPTVQRSSRIARRGKGAPR